MSNTGENTYKEILSQPEVWDNTLAYFQTKINSLEQSFAVEQFSEFIFTGCGSAYQISKSLAALSQKLSGIRSVALPASELYLFPAESLIPEKKSLLLAISRSGETTETLRAVEHFQKNHSGKVLGITCYEDSNLAGLIPDTLLVPGGGEKSVVQTRSLTGMFLLARAFLGLLNREIGYHQTLSKLPELLKSGLESYHNSIRTLAKDLSIDKTIYLASGYLYGLVGEGMLKLKEMSLSPTEAFRFMEFRHGPRAIVDQNTLIIGLLSQEAREEEIKILKELANLGARSLVINDTSSDLEFDFEENLININSGISLIYSLPLLIPPLQLFAYYRALRRGLNPDSPAHTDWVVLLS